MTKLSNNFSRSEFKCKCGKCDYDTVDAELVTILQEAREYFNTPITITSANRCPEYNRKVGGASKSQHVKGRAADITVAGYTPQEVQDYFKDRYSDKYGIGCYENFTHIDSRTGKARW